MWSRLSLVVSCSALLFQTTVLYPWHVTLSKQMKRLENQIEMLIESKKK